MIFSAASVGSKVGAGLSSAAVGAVLAAVGYISSDSTGAAAQQPASAVSAISNTYIWAPVVIWGVAAVVLFFYKLDKQYAGIMEELEERESRGEL